jgi:secreted trypsin-like serine protease
MTTVQFIKLEKLHYLKIFVKCPRKSNHILLKTSSITFPQGDSGGPLMYYKNKKLIQIGVLTFGSTECGYNLTANAAFISVPYFREWINSILSMQIQYSWK